MRQRRVSGIEERLSVYEDLFLRANGSFDIPACLPEGRVPRWYERGSGRFLLPEGFSRVYVEFGCGRGTFLNTLAAADPEALYIGIEGCKTIVIRAAEKTRAASLANTRFSDSFINDPAAAFGENSLDGIFLNFSDPWPKDRHAGRRLTAPKHTEGYLVILKRGGFAAVKTDSEPFFDYSHKVFEKTGFEIIDYSRNLPAAHDSPAADAAIVQTEYERKFRAAGKPIYYFKAKKP